MKIAPRATLLTYQPDVNIHPTWYPCHHLITPETNLTIQRGRWVTGDRDTGYVLHAYSDPSQSTDIARSLPTVNQRSAQYKLIPCTLSKLKGKLLAEFEEEVERRFAILQESRDQELSPAEEDRLIIPPLYARAVMDYTVLKLCNPFNVADHKKGREVHALFPMELDRLLKNFEKGWDWQNLADRTSGPPEKQALDPSRVRIDATPILMAGHHDKKTIPGASSTLPARLIHGSSSRPIEMVSSPEASPAKKRVKHSSRTEVRMDIVKPAVPADRTFTMPGKKQVGFFETYTPTPY